MANNWKIEGIPHKGWVLQEVYDVRAGGEAVGETQYETCMMCNNERIRYVHIVTHKDVKGPFETGCICAEKMTNDYENPRRLENDLKSEARKRSEWIKRLWNINQHGNHYYYFELHYLLIYKDKITGKCKCKIGDEFGRHSFNTIQQAKNALYTTIKILKERKQR